MGRTLSGAPVVAPSSASTAGATGRYAPRTWRPSWWRCIALFALALATSLTPADAQAAAPWQVGLLTQGPGVSWWYRVQADGREAAITTVPPGLGKAACVAPMDEPQTCVVIVRAGWLRVEADGALIGERLQLPTVTLPSPAGTEGAGAERERQRPAAGESALMESA